MTGPDLLEAGGPDDPERLRRSRRAWWSVGVVLALVLAGVLVLRSRPPSIPLLDIAPVAGTVELEAAPGAFRRSPTVLRGLFEASVRVGSSATDGPEVSVLGLAGPGLLAAGDRGRPVEVPRDGAAAVVRLPVAIDCGRVPLPLPADEYTLQVQAVAGSRHTDGRVALGGAAAPWSAQVASGCLHSHVERLVRVVAVSGSVDPRAPVVRLALTVQNSTSLEARVGAARAGGGTSLTAAPVTVAPGDRARLRIDARLDPCPTWRPDDTPTTTLATPLPIWVNLSGLPPSAPPDEPYAGLEPVAAADLQDMLVTACAGIASPVALTGPGNARYDAATRELRATVSLYLPVGWLGSVVVTPVAEEMAGRTGVRPLSGPTDPLRPDRTGLLRVPLRYAVPAGAYCYGGGPYLPLDVVARIPDGPAGRSARFQLYAETSLARAELAAACGARTVGGGPG